MKEKLTITISPEVLRDLVARTSCHKILQHRTSASTLLEADIIRGNRELPELIKEVEFLWKMKKK